MAGLDRIGGIDSLPTGQINNRRVDNKTNADAPSFKLPDDNDGGVIYEPSKPKEASKTLSERLAEEEHAMEVSKLHSRFDGPGVAVELSTRGVEASVKETPPSFLDTIRSFVDRIRIFFYDFWNGTDADSSEVVLDELEAASDVEEDSSLETVGTSIDADSSEDLVMPVRSNDPDEIASFMVDYGGKHLAKNTDLLTTYNRSGMLTSPNASDKRRILQGDRGVRKL